MTHKESYYKRFRAAGENAAMAWRNACILDQFTDLENDGFVRIVSEYEQESYFDVYGKPDSEKEHKSIEYYLELWGCHCVSSEYKDHEGEWQTADSIGMCVYQNHESPYENQYVPDLMQSAIDSAMAEHFVTESACI